MQRAPSIIFLACLAAGALAPGSPIRHSALAQEAAKADREYVLETHILGYRGVGGDIDGVRNPVLRAKQGETVRIVLVNVEPLAHDLAFETLQAQTKIILDVGQRTDLLFTAAADDVYYCTIPGHRAAGMEGRFEIIRAPGQVDADAASEEDALRAPLPSALPPLEDIALPPLDLDSTAPDAPPNDEEGGLLAHADEQVRARAAQRLARSEHIPEHTLNALARMAREDTSLLARAYLAEALRSVAPERRWDILEGLHGHAPEAADHTLPILIWYATEAVIPADPDRALTLALGSKWPHALSFTVQRIAEEGSQDALRTLTGRLPNATPDQRTILLDGVRRILQPTDP